MVSLIHFIFTKNGITGIRSKMPSESVSASVTNLYRNSSLVSDTEQSETSSACLRILVLSA